MSGTSMRCTGSAWRSRRSRDSMAEELAEQVNVIAARSIYCFDAGQFAESKIHYGLL
ncbi:MAG: hypothetical protein GY845_08510 [Planctomycetes bacterium]|nr:hypothetical protein [Planctomycetota bacterium]